MSALILLIEDARPLAYGVQSLLHGEGFTTLVAYEGAEGLALAQREPVDLVILDLGLPGMGGFEVLERLPRRDGRPAVLVLTARGEQAAKLRGFELGADDYLTKPFTTGELMARVRAVLRRTLPRPPAPEPLEYTAGDIVISVAHREVRRGGELVPLTPMEFDLLLALARRQGAVVDRNALLREVWAYQKDVVSRTVDTHVKTLRGKLEARPDFPRYIVTVRKQGYRFLGLNVTKR